jgi:hypothetical protein
MSSAPKPPNLRKGESAVVVVCPVCAAPRGVKCARERHALDGITHNQRIAAAAAWHTLNAAADRAERRRATETTPALHESPAKSAPRADRVEALAREWEGIARRIRLDLDRFPPDERDVQEARAQVWLAAAQDVRRAAAEGDPTECPGCAGKCPPPRRSRRRRTRCARRSRARSRSASRARAMPLPMHTGVTRGEPCLQP